jgi:hypothetical protein
VNSTLCVCVGRGECMRAGGRAEAEEECERRKKFGLTMFNLCNFTLCNVFVTQLSHNSRSIYVCVCVTYIVKHSQKGFR